MSKTTADQYEILKDLTWEVLRDLLSLPSKKAPPLYKFLSAASKGSLKERTPEEIELVHDQQARGGGVTLTDPPCAWVSQLEQVPEEAAHLFALVYQNADPDTLVSALQELRMMILQESFGRFANNLILGQKGRKLKRKRPEGNYSQIQVWHLAHREGYALGDALWERYLAGEVTNKAIQKWFQMDWWDARKNRTALKTLYKLTNEPALHAGIIEG